MRKLALAVHATVTNDEPFQLERLFPGKPLPKKLAAANTNLENIPTAELQKEQTLKEETQKEETQKEETLAKTS